MIYLRITLILIIIFSTLSGCARTTGIEPSRLKETKKKNHVIIENDFKWEEAFSIGQFTHYMTLKSGRYEAYLDDSEGTYYEGNGKCLELRIVFNSGKVAPRVDNARCGVYVPNSEKKRIIVYYYSDPEAAQAALDQTNPGVLLKALGKAELNNIRHLMYQPDALKTRLQIKISD